MFKSLQKFREENGLADVQPASDVTGPETELLNDLAQLLRKNADKFREIFRRCLNQMGLSSSEQDDMKRLIGIIASLKENPGEKSHKNRDPLDNVVVRPMNGPDGPGNGIGGGES